LLHHITTSAASGTTLEEALTSAVKGLQVTLGGDRVSMLLADEDRKNLTIKAWVGYSENASDLTIPFGSGITGWVAAHRKPLRVNDITQDARYILVSPNTRSELALPLIFRNDILGVLNVESEQIGAYTDNDEEMLGTLAGSLAAIIANARLVDQIRKQAERERLLNDISSKIRRSTDTYTILSTTIQEIQRVTGVKKAQIDIGITTEEQKKLNTEPLNAR
jgi:sigma-B regulation protein RsbU (phosphoserine phosphatase)